MRTESDSSIKFTSVIFFTDKVRDVSGTKYLCFIHTFCTPSDDQGDHQEDPFDDLLFLDPTTLQYSILYRIY